MTGSDGTPAPSSGGTGQGLGRRGRTASVAGAGGGVGTTTLAFALRGRDLGVYAGGPLDVLVCHASGQSLVRAAGVVSQVEAATGRKPVLAVTVAERGRLSRAVSARIDLLEPRVRGLVVVPHVRQWRQIDGVLTELWDALTAHGSRAHPRHLRGFLAATEKIQNVLRVSVPAPRSPSRPPHRSPLSRMATGPRRHQ